MASITRSIYEKLTKLRKHLPNGATEAAARGRPSVFVPLIQLYIACLLPAPNEYLQRSIRPAKVYEDVLVFCSHCAVLGEVISFQRPNTTETTLWVANLPAEVSHEHLFAVFSKHGPIYEISPLRRVATALGADFW